MITNFYGGCACLALLVPAIALEMVSVTPSAGIGQMKSSVVRRMTTTAPSERQEITYPMREEKSREQALLDKDESHSMDLSTSLGRINNITLLWLPTHSSSQKRIETSVCFQWPQELKQKLVLVDGINAADLNWNTSAVMRTDLAQKVFGRGRSNVISHEVDALAMFVDSPKTRAGAVALALGHMAIWQDVANGPAEGWTIVLEDDALIRPQDQSLRALENIRVPLETMVPNLVMLDPRHRVPRRQPTTASQCMKCPLGCGTVAYAIDRKAAKYLIEHASLNFALDMFLEKLQGESFKMTCPIETSPFQIQKSPSIKSPPTYRGSLLQSHTDDSEVDIRVCKNTAQL